MPGPVVTITEESEISERGRNKGPQAGGYIVLPFTVGAQLASLTNSLTWKTRIPCRVVHVSAHADTIASTPEYSVATPTGDVIASRALPEAVEEAYPGGGDVDLNAVGAANRDLAEGESLVVLFTTAGGETIDGGTVVVTLRVTGHPTAWDADND